MHYRSFITHPKKKDQHLNDCDVCLTKVGADLYMLEESSITNRDFKNGTIFKGKLVMQPPIGYPLLTGNECHYLEDYQIVRFGMMSFLGRIYRLSKAHLAEEKGVNHAQNFEKSNLYQAILTQTKAVGGSLETLVGWGEQHYLYIHLPKGKEAVFAEIEQLPDFDLEPVAFED